MFPYPLVVCVVFLYNRMKTGSKIKNSWNLEVLMFKIMESGFYCTNLEQINHRKLSNFLFKHPHK